MEQDATREEVVCEEDEAEKSDTALSQLTGTAERYSDDNISLTVNTKGSDGDDSQDKRSVLFTTESSDLPESPLGNVQPVSKSQSLTALLADPATLSSTSLSLSQRRLTSLPPQIGSLVSLERLGLSHNLLSTLPRSLSNLTKLRYLNLKGNLHTDIPSCLTALPVLEILDISRNKLKRLPDEPGTLVRLKVLSIARNRITALPTWFGDTELKVLKLEHNPLIWPPKDVLKCDAGTDPTEWVAKVRQWVADNAGRRRPKSGPLSATKEKWWIHWSEDKVHPPPHDGQLGALRELMRVVATFCKILHNLESSSTVSYPSQAAKRSTLSEELNTLDVVAQSAITYVTSSAAVHDDAKTAECLRSLTQATKSLLNTVRDAGIVRSHDVRLSRRVVGEWYVGNVDLGVLVQNLSRKSAVPRLAHSPEPAIVDAPPLTSATTSTPSTSALSSAAPARFEPLKRALLQPLYSLTNTTMVAAKDVIAMLKNAPQLRGVTDASNASAVATELLTTMEAIDAGMLRLEGLLLDYRTEGEQESQQSGDTVDMNGLRDFAGEVRGFIKAITAMSTAARSLSLSHPLPKPVLAGLQHLTRATKALALGIQKATEDGGLPAQLMRTMSHP
ncbi:hypothetical protein BC832DRAFT_245324 [Gaertneriomyces semiglobifer]|nr:hypothetical protein BC832DRAFT_245324 [Gaertneriomyces semiglobifer]